MYGKGDLFFPSLSAPISFIYDKTNVDRVAQNIYKSSIE